MLDIASDQRTGRMRPWRMTSNRPPIFCQLLSSPSMSTNGWHHIHHSSLSVIVLYLLISSTLSRPHQPIEKRPRKHKSTQSPKNISQPQIAKRPVEVFPCLALCFQQKQQHRDEQRARKIEDKTGVRFEAECARGNAEEGGSEIANIRYDLITSIEVDTGRRRRKEDRQGDG